MLRSFVELFRGDYTSRHLLGPLTPGQVISIGIIAAGAILLWKLPRKKTGVGEVVNTTMAGKA